MRRRAFRGIKRPTWTVSPQGQSSGVRFYGLGVYDGKLYTAVYDSVDQGRVSSHVFDGTSWSDGPMLRPDGGTVVNAREFAGKLVYSGLNAFDGETVTQVKSGVRDYKIDGDRLYTLLSTGLIKYTTDLVNWDTLGVAPDGSESLAILDNELYVGGGDGKLYRYSAIVPEPSTLTLVAIGLLGLCFRRPKRT